MLNSLNVNNGMFLNNKPEEKKFNSLDSCSHGGIYSTEHYLKVKIDFSSNINPLGISRQVLKEIREKIKQIAAIILTTINCSHDAPEKLPRFQNVMLLACGSLAM